MLFMAFVIYISYYYLKNRKSHIHKKSTFYDEFDLEISSQIIAQNCYTTVSNMTVQSPLYPGEKDRLC